MAYLEIETRDGTHRVQLERDRISIGRLSYNDVVLPYAQISRQHAEVRLLNGKWWITDLQSTNGVQINARRVQEQALASGDRIVLAPSISLRFVDESAHAASQSVLPGQAAQPINPDESSTTWAERIREQFALPGGASPSSLTQPVRPAARPEPFAPPDSYAPLRPRSPFSEDETPFLPPGMPPPAPPGLRSPFPPFPTGAPGVAGRPPFGSGNNPFSKLSGGAPNDSVPEWSGANGGNGGNGGIETFGAGSIGGYPAPPGPLRSGAGAGAGDPFLRNGPADEGQRATSGPASTLLHVCQTCGQLTAPDAVYCQSCHHSIAHECANCRLSLLPIQERCPRCHTPNQSSVRRSHPNRADM